MNVGFVGLGNLGRYSAEVIAEHYNLEGYDIRTVDTTVKQVSLDQVCKDKHIIFIAVPTPHDPLYDGREPTSHLPPKDFDYSIAKEVVQEVDSRVDSNTLVVLISTVLPGTVRREIAPLVKNARFIYNPYLIAQGSVKWDMVNPEMVIIGTEDGDETSDAGILRGFYEKIIKPGTRYVIGTWEEAEGIKIFYNTFISAKLSLVNMIQDVAQKVGNMNVDVITDALKYSDKRIMGPSYMSAGLGDGGGCHPRDNIALSSIVDRYDLGYDLFQSIMYAREIQSKNLAEFLCSFDMPIVIVGKAFKPGIDQIHGSPSMLVGHYCETEFLKRVYYDQTPDPSVSYVFMLHDYEMFKNVHVPANSVIVDVFRKLDSPVPSTATVIKYGNTRP
jgi:UDPglucose 6-dehydrogenase